MPYRYTNIRIVEPTKKSDRIEFRPVSLLWAALAAAEETMQGSPLASAWLRLFQGHLSISETQILRWRDDLAESTEMRRAYSAMYGRYFSRALLASRFGFTNFVPLSRNDTPIENGVTVRRIKRGDIPDWIAWDPAARSYVLAEAKGSLTGRDRNFLYERPTCVATGKAQFDRVEVIDSHNRIIRTRNWVAANLWTTDERRRRSVSLLWDPEGDGDELLSNEIPVNAAAIRGRRIANIAMGLGRPKTLRLGAENLGQTVRISIQPSEDDLPPEPAADKMMRGDKDSGSSVFPPIEEPSREKHEDVYVAALITLLGIRPIRDSADLVTTRSVQHRVRKGNEPAMVYGISTSALTTADYKQTIWLSGGGLASPDGAALFDLKQIELDDA